MKLDPSKISSVNGYDIIEIEGAYGVFEEDVRDGLRQVGPAFDTFRAAAEHALALSNPDPTDKFQLPRK